MPWRTWWRWGCIRLDGFGSFERVYLRYDDRDRSTTSSASVKALDQARVSGFSRAGHVERAAHLSFQRGTDRNVASIAPARLCRNETERRVVPGLRVRQWLRVSHPTAV